MAAGSAKDKKRKKPHPDLGDEPFDCMKCGGKCCRYFALEIDEPEDFDDFDSIRWYLYHGSNYVFVEEGKWYLCVTTHCRNLDGNRRCLVYDRRPLICREHDASECEFEDEMEWNYDRCFRTPEEVEKYMRKQFGRRCFEKKYKKFEAKKARKGKNKDKA